MRLLPTVFLFEENNLIVIKFDLLCVFKKDCMGFLLVDFFKDPIVYSVHLQRGLCCVFSMPLILKWLELKEEEGVFCSNEAISSCVQTNRD